MLGCAAQQLLHRLTKAGLAPDALDPPCADPHPLEALLQRSLERRLHAAGKELGHLSSFLFRCELAMHRRHVNKMGNNVTNWTIQWEE